MGPEVVVIGADLEVASEYELSLWIEVQSQHDTALLVVPPFVADDGLLAIEVEPCELFLEALIHVIAVELPVKLR